MPETACLQVESLWRRQGRQHVRHYQERGAWSNGLLQSMMQAHKSAVDPELSAPPPPPAQALLWKAQQKKANTHTRVFFLSRSNKKPSCKTGFSCIQNTLLSPREDTKAKGALQDSWWVSGHPEPVHPYSLEATGLLDKRQMTYT